MNFTQLNDKSNHKFLFQHELEGFTHFNNGFLFKSVYGPDNYQLFFILKKKGDMLLHPIPFRSFVKVNQTFDIKYLQCYHTLLGHSIRH